MVTRSLSMGGHRPESLDALEQISGKISLLFFLAIDNAALYCSLRPASFSFSLDKNALSEKWLLSVLMWGFSKMNQGLCPAELVHIVPGWQLRNFPLFSLVCSHPIETHEYAAPTPCSICLISLYRTCRDIGVLHFLPILTHMSGGFGVYFSSLFVCFHSFHGKSLSRLNLI